MAVLKILAVAVIGLVLLRLLFSRWVKCFIKLGPAVTWATWRAWRKMPKEIRHGSLEDAQAWWDREDK